MIEHLPASDYFSPKLCCWLKPRFKCIDCDAKCCHNCWLVADRHWNMAGHLVARGHNHLVLDLDDLDFRIVFVAGYWRTKSECLNMCPEAYKRLQKLGYIAP